MDWDTIEKIYDEPSHSFSVVSDFGDEDWP
jgi:hypothetical protein